MLALALNPDQPVIRNRIGIYGAPERYRLGSKLVILRETEVKACKHILNPGDPDFVPPAAVPSKLICHQCKKRKAHDAFGVDTRCVTRGGRRTECTACRNDNLKLSRLKRRSERKKGA
jgi:hypothetical protein